MLTTPLCKLGVDISKLERHTRFALAVTHRIYKTHNEILIITSTYEGNHSAGSLHYANQAFDIRPPVHEPGKVLAVLKSDLGKDYDVVVEATHWHIEYDPKG